MKRKIDRFLVYLDRKGISENKATVDCQLSQGLLYRAKVGMSDIGNKAVEKILATYPDLSRVWLLTGEGDMLVSDSPAPAQPGQNDLIVQLLKEQNAELQAKIDMLNQQIGELNALLKKEREEIAGAAGSSFSADAV